MRRFLNGGIALFALTGVTAASAADLPTTASPTERARPRAAAAFDWNGTYFGANLGYSWGKWDSTGAVQNGSVAPSVNGILGGVQLGHNWLTNNRLLLGLEADIQITAERKSISWVIPPAAVIAVVPGTPVTNSWKFPWFGTLRGRIGYAPDKWLLYFTGGLVVGQTKSEFTTPAVSLTDSVTKWGWTIGSGLETALSDRLTAKVEYLYIDLGSRIFFGNTTVPVNSKLRDNVIRIGLNHKFR